MKQRKDGEGTQIGPHYTLIIPFRPAMNDPRLLSTMLLSESRKAEIDIGIRYCKVKAALLTKKLRNVVRNVAGVPHGKTMAILISDFTEKIYFFTPTGNLPRPSL